MIIYMDKKIPYFYMYRIDAIVHAAVSRAWGEK